MFIFRHYAALCALLVPFFVSCAVRMPVKKNIPEATQPVSNVSTARPQSKTVPVWLIADSLHTQIAFQYDWLVENGYRPPANLKFPQGPRRYVVMSWGDRTAYVQRRWLTPWEVANALFMPSDSVTEIVPVSWKIEEVCFQQRIFQGEVPRSRGRQLAHFLNSSSRRNKQGNPIIIAESTWGQGYLLDCPHSYYFPRICNVWTGQCLEACGLTINMKCAISANGLVRQTEKQGFTQIHKGIKGYGR